MLAFELFMLQTDLHITICPFLGFLLPPERISDAHSLECLFYPTLCPKLGNNSKLLRHGIWSNQAEALTFFAAIKSKGS